MAIEFKCLCGAACAADESKAGQLHHCEACGLDIPVPAPDADLPNAEIVDEGSVAAEGAEGAVAAATAGIDVLRGEVTAKAVEGISEEEAARRKADREAFQAQLGRKAGADELIAQITGKRPEKPADGGPGATAAAEGAAAPGAPGAPAPAPAAMEMRRVLRLAAPAKPLPTGKARAASHIRIKRVVWAPSLVFGVVCLALGLYNVDALTLNRLPYHRRAVYPEVRTEDPQFVTDEQGKMWAMPKGATPSPHADGRMWYLNDVGTEEPAESVEDWQKAAAYDRDQRETALWFSVSFLITALALLFLGLWTLKDVRLVRREMGAAQIPTADVATGAAASAATGAAEATAPETPPAEGGAPAQEAAPPPESPLPPPVAAATEGMPPAAPAPESASSAPPGEAGRRGDLPAAEAEPPKQA